MSMMSFGFGWRKGSHKDAQSAHNSMYSLRLEMVPSSWFSGFGFGPRDTPHISPHSTIDTRRTITINSETLPYGWSSFVHFSLAVVKTDPCQVLSEKGNNCKYKLRGRSYSFCGAAGVCYHMRCFSLYGHMKLQMQIFLKVHDDSSNAPV